MNRVDAPRGKSAASHQPEAKNLFEIYHEPEPGGGYRVIYFTELDPHERDIEVERVMRAAHVFDGFVPAGDEAAKAHVTEILTRLNAGELLDATAIQAALAGVLV